MHRRGSGWLNRGLPANAKDHASADTIKLVDSAVAVHQSTKKRKKESAKGGGGGTTAKGGGGGSGGSGGGGYTQHDLDGSGSDSDPEVY